MAIESDDFLIKAGERLWVHAPSGFGKTSFLRAIAGFEACHGEMGYQNEGGAETLIQALPPHRRQFGILFQDQLLLSHLNATDNVMLALKINKIEGARASERVSTGMKDLGLESRMNAPVTQLSGGERQRVALLRSLIFEPKLLILDEPFRGLDVLSHERMNSFLNKFLEDHPIPMIIISHQPEKCDFELIGESKGNVRKFILRPGTHRS